jgi:putative methionine-R-sulfoxide reductase with GAF domain
MPFGQGTDRGSDAQDPPEDPHQRIISLLAATVDRLKSALPDAEVGGLLEVGGALRHTAHAGSLRMIWEVPREQGGVAWRAVESGEVQLVEDVRRDPDYLASDARVRSEIAAPVVWRDTVVAVLDVEFPERVFTASEAAIVRAEAEGLRRDLSGRPGQRS